MSLFSIRLKQLRKKYGETQESLAEYLGVQRTTISSYERKINVPPYDKAKKIADRYGVNINYLMGKSYDPIMGAISNDKEIDIGKSLTLISDVLYDTESALNFNGKVLSQKQKENILLIITNTLNMIDLVTQYE